MMFIGLLWLVVLLLVVRWLFPGGGGRALPEQTRRTEAELARMREEVDRLSAQVERLLEEQSFLVRLLSEREEPLPLGRGGGSSGEAGQPRGEGDSAGEPPRQ